MTAVTALDTAPMGVTPDWATPQQAKSPATQQVAKAQNVCTCTHDPSDPLPHVYIMCTYIFDNLYLMYEDVSYADLLFRQEHE